MTTPLPSEWLLALSQEPDRARALVHDLGLAAAAHAVARARVMSTGYHDPTPTRPEVHSAAVFLTISAGATTPAPSASVIASECAAEGLPII